MKDNYKEEYAFRKGYKEGQDEGFEKGIIKGMYLILSGDVGYRDAYNKIRAFLGYDFAEVNAGYEHDTKALFANICADPNDALYVDDRFDAGYKAACYDMSEGNITLRDAAFLAEGEFPVTCEERFVDSDCQKGPQRISDRKSEDYKNGYSDACFDFLVGNIDREKAFQLVQSDLDIVRKK